MAVFAPNIDTPYRVEHYKQELSGEYPTSPSESQSLQ